MHLSQHWELRLRFQSQFLAQSEHFGNYTMLSMRPPNSCRSSRSRRSIATRKTEHSACTCGSTAAVLSGRLRRPSPPPVCSRQPASCKRAKSITLILIPRTIFMVVSIWHQPYPRVHFVSSRRKSVSDQWLPIRRPDCKLDPRVRL